MRPDINLLLEKYWECNTSIDEEYELKSYFRAGDISDEHLPFVDLFSWMDDRASVKMDYTLDMDEVLNRYWEGETTLREEEMIKAYFKSGNVAENHTEYSDLFHYFDEQKNVTFPVNHNLPAKEAINTDVKETKIFSIRKILLAVAAVSVLVFSAVNVFQIINDNSHKQQTAEIIEIEDPDEALRVTREALALVSTKFRESQETVRKNMEPLEKAAIFK
ncbi:MAG: hypothetical protein IPK35_14625 [Saprospiraceae bacterium]|jgi:hypothetical protein|nr:hypothetical protein [Saprospiraceae bacterium]